MVTINTESALTPRSLRDTRRMNMFVSVAAAVAGLLFGLDIGVIAGALPFITDHFVLTSRLQEWVVSSMMLGAAIGALFNGWLSFRLGRKYSLMAGAILFVLGSIGSAFATSVEMLIAARVVLGIAVGIASYTAPLYLSEMASENVRGKMISMYQLMVTLGIVLAFLSDTAFSYSGNWRAMLGVLALPAVLLIILVVFLPNSPRWLAEKGRHIEAEEVLRMLRDTSEKAREELNEIRESLKLKQGGWALFKINRNVRRAVFLGMLLQAMLRANAATGNLNILLPMVTSLDEVDEARRLIERAGREVEEMIGYEIPKPRIGIMLEVPSMVFMLPHLAKRVDFISVGTNDLTQYILAVDRNNTRVANIYDSLHPAMLRALAMIAREAEIHGIDLRLCGEMAGDPMCVAILIGLGYRHLSMNGRSVARVKYLLRRIDYAEAENLAQRSLEAQLATEVRHQVAAFMERRGMGGLIRGGL